MAFAPEMNLLGPALRIVVGAMDSTSDRKRIDRNCDPR